MFNDEINTSKILKMAVICIDRCVNLYGHPFDCFNSVVILTLHHMKEVFDRGGEHQVAQGLIGK